MSKQERDIVNYIVVCISEFSNFYSIQMREAYIFLKRYKGIDFLREFYDVEHTLSFEDTINDVTMVCQKNGGNIG